jgi:parallel beta-helix repeat protein
MEKKTASSIMLTLLLTSMLTLAFNIQPAKASGTIYIRADGSIEPPSTPISSVDNVTYTFSNNISDSIVIERDNILVDGMGYVLRLPEPSNTRGISVSGRNNVTIKNVRYANLSFGVYLENCSNCTITETCSEDWCFSAFLLNFSSMVNIFGNNITEGGFRGILLTNSNYNMISDNRIGKIGKACGRGIELYSSSSHNDIRNNIIVDLTFGLDLESGSDWNNVYGNSITGGSAYSDYGIYVSSSNNNNIYENNVSNNTEGIYVEGSFGAAQGNYIARNNVTANRADGIYLCNGPTSTIIHNNTVTANQGEGIRFYGASQNVVSDNNIASNYGDGILLTGSSNNNTVSGNTISQNSQSGLRTTYSLGQSNTIFHNNFLNNSVQASIDYAPPNIWDSEYPSGGNYWSDYTGADLYSGPFQNETGNDGIGDAPYVINSEEVDRYPLIHMWTYKGLYVSIAPTVSTTSIGGTVTYDITVKNFQNSCGTFTMSIEGLNESWCSLRKDRLYVIAWETAVVKLIVTVPDDPSDVGVYPFVATISGLLAQEVVKSTLSVQLNPIIRNLEPQNDITLGSNNLLVSWSTSSNSSSEVYIKRSGDLAFDHVVGNYGTEHFVNVYNLSRNADYFWYAYSEASYGNVTSELRTLHVSTGLSFAQHVYTFYLERDYAQHATISVINLDTQSHDLLLQALNPYEDLIVGFVGAGSVDQNVTLSPNETRLVDFYIHAQDAMQQSYTFTVKLTELGAEEIVDYALVNVDVRQPNISLIMVEESTDPVTLSKTITATNYGDPVTDLYIDTSDELTGKVLFKPTVYHAYVPTGGSLTFEIVPVLTVDFTGFQGLILATGAGRVIASLQANFTLPLGKRVFSVTIPQVTMEFSNYYDSDESPNTNPLPDRPVESYLANGTVIFASQIIVDVYQNNTPTYGANVSLTIWNEIGAVESVESCDTDITGKAMFNVVGMAGNYSYEAELPDYGLKAERRYFSVNMRPLYEIHPNQITWLDASDDNSTFLLAENLSRVVLDQAPFVFRVKKESAEANATAILCFRWEYDIQKKIYIPGSVLNDTIVFKTSCIPQGNFSAIVLYYSSANGLYLSTPLNVTNKDPSSMYTQGNYTYYTPFPFNSTCFIRLQNQRIVTSRDSSVSFDLINIEPAGSDLYLFRYVIVSREDTLKTFSVHVETDSGWSYNRSIDIYLESGKPLEVNFTVPVYTASNTLVSKINSTLSMGSASVLIVTKSSLVYLYDTQIWVGAYDGILGMLDSVLRNPTAQATVTCGGGVLVDWLDMKAHKGGFVGSFILDGIEFATSNDLTKQKIIVAKWGLATMLGGGVAIGSILCPEASLPAGAFVFGGTLLVGDIVECTYDWTKVLEKASQDSKGNGVSSEITTYIQYCTNNPVVTIPIDIPRGIIMLSQQNGLNIKKAMVITHFSLPWSRDTYRPHNVHILVNGIEIGSLTNTVPEGYYMFPFDGALLNYANDGVAQNTVTMRMDNLNGGHYVVSSNLRIVLQVIHLDLAVVATNETEAQQIASRLAGSVANLPDFGVYANSIAFSDTQPKEGEIVTIGAKIFNFGTIGFASVPADLYVDSAKVATSLIAAIPAFSNQTIEFSWKATRGTHNIAIVVNADHLILESDYSNNQAQASITVAAVADDVAIASITPSKNVVGQGFLLNITVTAANHGDFTETFNITLYTNTTCIATQSISLASKDFTTLTFTWNTTGFALGNYTISAYAWPVSGETDTADNTFVNGAVKVAITGDINGDGHVNILDAILLGNAFDSKPGEPAWSPNADINGDGYVNILDAIMLGNHFDEKEP